MLGQIVEELATRANLALASYDVEWHIRVFMQPTVIVKLVVYVPGVNGGRGRLVDGGIIYPMTDDPAYAKFATERLVKQIEELLRGRETG